MTRNEELRKLIADLVTLNVGKAVAEHTGCYTHEWCRATKEQVARELPKVKARIEELLKEC